MSLHYKLVDVSESSFQKLRTINANTATEVKTEAARLDKEEAYALRAAVVAACEVAVQEAKMLAQERSSSMDSKKLDLLNKVTAVDVDGFLWSVAKDGKLRQIPRIAERGSVFY